MAGDALLLLKRRDRGLTMGGEDIGAALEEEAVAADRLIVGL